MTAGYRDQRLPAVDNGDARLAHLRAQMGEGLPAAPPDDPWGGGRIPEDEIDAATRRWETEREELLGADAADRDAYDRFFELTLRLSNALPAPERAALTERAIEAQAVPEYAVAHRASLASAAVREGRLAAARAWLEGCVESPHLLGDSAYRVARATLALSEDDADAALECLGERDGSLPIASAYDVLAGVVRAHALDRAGRRPEAWAELDRWIDRVGLTTTARIVDKLPAEWDVDRARLNEPLRAVGRTSATVGLSMAAACVIGAGVAVWLGIAFEPVAFVACVVLGALAARIGLRAAREWRLVGAGTVTGATVRGRRRVFWTPLARRLYHLELAIDGAGAEPLSLQGFDGDRSEALVGASVRVIWDPARPSHAWVDPASGQGAARS